jgi:hypothetical protein
MQDLTVQVIFAINCSFGFPFIDEKPAENVIFVCRKITKKYDKSRDIYHTPSENRVRNKHAKLF